MKRTNIVAWVARDTRNVPLFFPRSAVSFIWCGLVFLFKNNFAYICTLIKYFDYVKYYKMQSCKRNVWDLSLEILGR